MLSMYKKISNVKFKFICNFYLISSVFFILALKGLSSPESSRKGNIFGMMGMAIAIITLILQ